VDTPPELTILEPGPAASIRAQIAMAELPAFFGSAFGELAACAADNIAGPPFAIYHSFDPARIDVEAVMPVRSPVTPRGRVKLVVLEGGPAVQVRHLGPYDELHLTHSTIERWIAANHRAKSGPVREVYMSPPSVQPEQHVTVVIQPLQAA
jgi:effector-binding domain-containing protein